MKRKVDIVNERVVGWRNGGDEGRSAKSARRGKEKKEKRKYAIKTRVLLNMFFFVEFCLNWHRARTPFSSTLTQINENSPEQGSKLNSELRLRQMGSAHSRSFSLCLLLFFYSSVPSYHFDSTLPIRPSLPSFFPSFLPLNPMTRSVGNQTETVLGTGVDVKDRGLDRKITSE